MHVVDAGHQGVSLIEYVSDHRCGAAREKAYQLHAAVKQHNLFATATVDEAPGGRKNGWFETMYAQSPFYNQEEKDIRVGKRSFPEEINTWQEWCIHKFQKDADYFYGQSPSRSQDCMKVAQVSPKTYTLAEISKHVEHVAHRGQPRVYVVPGFGVNGLCKVSLGDRAIVQLASQFNFLESTTPDAHMPVSEYIHDMTQGPLGAVETAMATLKRHAMVTHPDPQKRLKHALHDVLPQEVQDNGEVYKNGYFMPEKFTQDELRMYSRTIRARVQNLRILPQWSYCERGGVAQLYVMAAAPYFSSVPQEETALYGMANLLISRQYQALGKLALLRAHKSKPESSRGDHCVPVHVTLVGLGVFHNNPKVLKKALSSMVEAAPDERVVFYIHAFSGQDEQWVYQALDAEEIPYTKMDKQTFITQTSCVPEQKKQTDNFEVQKVRLDTLADALRKIKL